MPHTLNQRLAILLTLYLAQGLPTGIFSQALPAILRSYDVSPDWCDGALCDG